MISVEGEANELFAQVAAAVFTRLRLSGDAVVDVSLAGKERIRAVNRETRGVDRATDVLSFPALDGVRPFTRRNFPYDYDEAAGGVRLGSILICDEIAREQAAEYGHSERRECGYLFLHALLHLLGYDHENESDKQTMRAAEEDVLRSLGLTRDAE